MRGRSQPLLATAGRHQSRRPSFRCAGLITLLVVGALAATPGVAAADGPTAPVATDYLARLHHVPAALEAKIVDGYLRMWLRVPARETVVVLDYRGAPYLRFARAGVAVNENSEMYYLNQTPVSQHTAGDLSRRTTPAHWVSVSNAHDYEWHDGRLNGLAMSPSHPARPTSADGASRCGRWPHLTRFPAGSGTRADPSIVWFWPIAVLLLCVFAAWRVRRPSLDRADRAVLGVPALIALRWRASRSSSMGARR
jgi:hypothetical protein